MDNQVVDVDRLAELANLALTQEETDAFAKNFDEVLSFLESITDTDLSVPIVSERIEDMREDEIGATFCRDELLANAATTSGGYITVPSVMEDL